MTLKLPAEAMAKAVVLASVLGFIYLLAAQLPLRSNVLHPKWDQTVEKTKNDILFQTAFSNQFFWNNLKCDRNTTREASKELHTFLSEEAIISRTEDCGAYFEHFPVLEDWQPKNRSDFPLAFSHLVHHEIGVLEAFLASWFRPSDMHCFYIDRKASEAVRKAVYGLINCYRQKFYPSAEEWSNQIFVHDESELIYWGDSSILKAELACLRQLLINDRQSKTPWKYFLNMAGSELPLKSEEWTRQMLSNLNGESLVESYDMPKGMAGEERMKKQYYLKWDGNEKDSFYVVASGSKGPPPFNLTVVKGTKNIIISKNFSNFITLNSVATDFFHWAQDMCVPDEHYYNTLVTISSIESLGDGGKRVVQDLGKDTLHRQCTRTSLWYYDSCKGTNINGVCNVAVEDLPKLREQGCVIGNKFRLSVDAMAVACQMREIFKGSGVSNLTLEYS